MAIDFEVILIAEGGTKRFSTWKEAADYHYDTYLRTSSALCIILIEGKYCCAYRSSYFNPWYKHDATKENKDVFAAEVPLHLSYRNERR